MRPASLLALGAASLVASASACAGGRGGALSPAVFSGSQGTLLRESCQSAAGGDADRAACELDAARRLLQYSRDVNACYGYEWRYHYSTDVAFSNVPRERNWMRLSDQPNLRHAAFVGNVAACYDAATAALDPVDQHVLFARMCGMGEKFGCACMKRPAGTDAVELEGYSFSCAGGRRDRVADTTSPDEILAELTAQRAPDHANCRDPFCKCARDGGVGACADAAASAADAVGAYEMLAVGCSASTPRLVGACYGGERLETQNRHFRRPLSGVLQLALCAAGLADDAAACSAELEAYREGVLAGEERLAEGLAALANDEAAIEDRQARWAANRERLEAESNARRDAAIAAGLQDLGVMLRGAGAPPPPVVGPSGEAPSTAEDAPREKYEPKKFEPTVLCASSPADVGRHRVDCSKNGTASDAAATQQ